MDLDMEYYLGLNVQMEIHNESIIQKDTRKIIQPLIHLRSLPHIAPSGKEEKMRVIRDLHVQFLLNLQDD